MRISPNREEHPMNDEKLQKVLATAGFGSRREMERVIDAGLVTVNGVTATLGSRVKAGDKLIIDGHRYQVPDRAETQDELRVLLYNKPEGEICSRNDPEGRPTVYDRLPPLSTGRWISVGRLDFNTSGLLLFTNNGELANKLMHPSSGIDREYLVRVQGEVSKEQLQQLRDGVQLEDGLAKFTDITIGGGKGSNTWFYCTLMEGKNREVRRLWEAQGCRVSRLKRVRYGQILIPSYVRMGQWVELGLAETTLLCDAAGIKPPSKKNLTRNEFLQRERREQRLRASPGKPTAVKSRAHRSRTEREAFIARASTDPHAKPGIQGRPSGAQAKSGSAATADTRAPRSAANPAHAANPTHAANPARAASPARADAPARSTRAGAKAAPGDGAGARGEAPRGRAHTGKSSAKPHAKSAGKSKPANKPQTTRSRPKSERPKRQD